MSGGDAMKRVEARFRADDSYVHEFGLTCQKSSQFVKRFREATVETTSPRQGRACYRYGGDLLIPEVQVNHLVTGTAKRPIGKHDITVQSPELSPKNALRLLSVLEDTLPPLQPTIEGKNELRPKWPLGAVCWSLRQATKHHRTPEVSPLMLW
jgi:hypothetical protein